jgi:hypothetical protein
MTTPLVTLFLFGAETDPRPQRRLAILPASTIRDIEENPLSFTRRNYITLIRIRHPTFASIISLRGGVVKTLRNMRR